LAAEERNDSGRWRRAAAVGGGSGGGIGGTIGAGQRQGQGQGQGCEAIPMENMVPDGDGGWVEPPPPYVADPKPVYHP